MPTRIALAVAALLATSPAVLAAQQRRANNSIRQAPPAATLTPSVTCDCRTVLAPLAPQTTPVTVWKTETVPPATGSVVEWTSWTHWTSSWTNAPEPAPSPASACPESCKCEDVTDIVR